MCVSRTPLESEPKEANFHAASDASAFSRESSIRARREENTLSILIIYNINGAQTTPSFGGARRHGFLKNALCSRYAYARPE